MATQSGQKLRVTVVTGAGRFFWYTESTLLITVCSSRGSRFLRLDSSPPFLPAVDLREIQIQCERQHGSRCVSECA